MSKSNRFSALRDLHEQRQKKEKTAEFPKKQKKPKMNKQAVIKPVTPAVASPATVESPKKGPGRPPGRRSNPDYTQISAYVPLDLILSVQEELARDQRQNKQRTARPVSDLVEELLKRWLKKLPRERSET